MFLIMCRANVENPPETDTANGAAKSVTVGTVNLSVKKLTLYVDNTAGETVKLSIASALEKASNLQWACAPDGIAKVDGSGLEVKVLPLAVGTTILTVTGTPKEGYKYKSDKKVEASCEITVAAGVVLTPAQLNLSTGGTGTTVTLNMPANYKTALAGGQATIEWSSTNTSVARVTAADPTSDTATVTPQLADGTAEIQATFKPGAGSPLQETSSICDVTVTIPPTTGQDEPVPGQEATYDLMVKFGMKSPGYKLSTITSTDVSETFTHLSAYLKTLPANAVNPYGGLETIRMGDFIELPSLFIAKYTDSNVVIAEEVNIPSNVGNGKLQLVIVAINPYYGKNSNGTVTPHLIFQFKNAPGTGKMNATTADTSGYSNSSIRYYLMLRYYLALVAAGVPESVFWNITRKVPYDDPNFSWNNLLGFDYSTIKDYVWLPTEYEITGQATLQSSDQMHFSYYNSNDRRLKVVTYPDNNGCYWTSSSTRSAYFQAIGSSGTVVAQLNSTTKQGIAPAFAIK
ncbi:MAG: hypothetical protein LBG74_06300 [Spirochaetaceae bacterium]|jgi:hypothetical protein|nr:hypothetical protein [Spirochaetaceae bacterium]